MAGARSVSVVASGTTLSATEIAAPTVPQQVRTKTDAKSVDAKKKVQPLSFGIVTRVKDGVAFARDLGFASFGELVIFVPSPARLKAMQKDAGATNYVDGMIVGLERDLTSVVILGNERLVKVRRDARAAVPGGTTRHAAPHSTRTLLPRAHKQLCPFFFRRWATASWRARVSLP